MACYMAVTIKYFPVPSRMRAEREVYFVGEQSHMQAYLTNIE